MKNFVDTLAKLIFSYYQIFIENVPVIVYRFINVGNDDGWLFIFDSSGTLITAGQTHEETITWAKQELLKQYQDPEDLLKDYWGCGLPGFWESCKKTQI